MPSVPKEYHLAFLNRFYPHLLPPDIPVWERFLAVHGHKYVNIDYDVRVGMGRLVPGLLTQKLTQMSIDLSQRRIDAVGVTADAIHIIEITQYAGLRAVGQLTTYPILYQATYHPLKKLVPVLVCETLAPDVEQAFLANSVEIYQMHNGTASPEPQGSDSADFEA